MYEKDKSQRITLRLNQSQFDFVKDNADMLGVSPSDFLRMVINATMCTSNAATKALNERETQNAIIKEAKETYNTMEGQVDRRENEQADKHNIL